MEVTACHLAPCSSFGPKTSLSVGGFREEMPLVYQDTDLCMRLSKKTGGSILYDPTYPLNHVGSLGPPAGKLTVRSRPTASSGSSTYGGTS